MNTSVNIYIIIGLLYSMGGVVLVGIALLASWSTDADLENIISEQQRLHTLFQRTRQYLDGLVGIVMLFTGFALQAIGHVSKTANSNISFLLISALLFLLLVHLIYTRDVLAGKCVQQKMRTISKTQKNKAYFGHT